MRSPTQHPPRYDVVCCSLEPWDEVWRRNQFFALRLLELRPSLRLLFVETSVDIPWSILHRRRFRLRRLRPIGDSGRLWALRPRKWLPRKVWAGVDRSLGRQVIRASRKLGLVDPVLWVNDSDYADLIAATGWPTVYDVTDDWVLGFDDPAVVKRQRENDQRMVDGADEVVVCSDVLAQSRGRERPVHVITNGVEIDHFRSPRSRPSDLPDGRIVLYTGTLVAGRLDLPLCSELARSLTRTASLVFVGPSSLTGPETQNLVDAGAVILGGRPYTDMPAYLQYADVIVVPHLVTPFTESLDPIKAREAVAVGRPTVSTPVAGFRGLERPITVADRTDFAAEVSLRLSEPQQYGPGPLAQPPGTWADRGHDFAEVLDSAAGRRANMRSSTDADRTV